MYGVSLTRRLIPGLFLGVTVLLGIALMGDLRQVGQLLLCGAGLVFWLFFFAQFTLPLRDLPGRYSAFKRLFLYTLGLAGPVVRIENGNILERKSEVQRHGPGVVLLDTASAAVIRSPGAFVKTVGPGVAFTETLESIAGTVDLHIQRGKLGPDENEDPFAPQGDDEEPAAYSARQERRFQTRGLTRDGFEIAPRITVSARLDARPGEGGTNFGFNPLAVRNAIKGRPIDPTQPADALDTKVDLAWLPLHLAADVWKEALSGHTLEELFDPLPGKKTALQLIVQHMRDRLTRSSYDELDPFGRPTGTQLQSREYKILKDRGIRVVGVQIAYLKFHEDVEKTLEQYWKSTWLVRAQREREYVEQLRSYELDAGRREALDRYAQAITRALGGLPSSSELSGEQILRHLLRGSLDLVNQESYLHRLTADEASQLKELLEWSAQRSEEK
ncbi:MAG TPA: hypothetical protein VHO48_12905 [Anaerolineaceae bacterium]|nr:hypothetical protein [Anaerolineaceae bacterium]